METARRLALKRKYGMTQVDYKNMLERQGNRCDQEGVINKRGP
jgi:hypothetical protein